MQKIKYALISACISLAIISCSLTKSDNPCERYMEQETMIAVLKEVYLLEAHISRLQSTSSIRDSVDMLYAGIFQRHQITASQFERAFDCYLLNRELTNHTLDEVLNALSIERSKSDEKKDEEFLREVPMGVE